MPVPHEKPKAGAEDAVEGGEDAPDHACAPSKDPVSSAPLKSCEKKAMEHWSLVRERVAKKEEIFNNSLNNPLKEPERVLLRNLVAELLQHERRESECQSELQSSVEDYSNVMGDSIDYIFDNLPSFFTRIRNLTFSDESEKDFVLLHQLKMTNHKVENWFSLKVFIPDIVDESDKCHLNNPHHFGLKNAKSFFIESGTIKLGAWLVEPTKEFSGTNIVYVHGIHDSRAYDHRVGMYKLLTDLGHRVLTFDYRGFGDSSSVCPINEMSTTEDTKLVLDWAKEHFTPVERVVVWGHSMGTAISTSTVCQNSPDGFVVGLVLESPYSSFSDQVESSEENIVTRLAIHLVRNIIQGFQFETDENLRKVKVPVMILHAEDDEAIDVELGKALYKTAKEHGVDAELHVFPASLQHGHNNIFKDNNLPGHIAQFLGRIPNHL